MKNLSLIRKQWWLIIGIGAFLIVLAYNFFTDWRWLVPGNSEVIISLRRTGCFGSCASYKVTLFDNGTILYEGFSYVGIRGIRKANIGAEAVQKLAAELENTGYFLLQDNYTEEMSTDSASVFTYVKIGAREKSIEHYGGDLNAPEELYRLENLIDDTANSTRWINACSFWYPNSCSYNLVFWLGMAMPLVLAVVIVWLFIKQRRTIIGIILGEAVVAVIWLFLVQLANSRDVFGASLSTILFYQILGFSEFVVVLPIGLFLIRRYKENATPKNTG